MKNIFFFDQELNNQANGVITYRNELFKYFEKQESIQLHYVKLIKEHSIPTKKVRESCIAYVLSISSSSSAKNVTVVSLEFLIGEIRNYENIILHFNWLNDLSLGFYIRQRIKCKIVLTKHSIAWRNTIVTDYETFFAMNKVFEKKEKSHPIYNSRRLKENYFLYAEVDHIITVTECAKKSIIHFSKTKEDKISTIYNGLSPVKNYPTPYKKALLREKYGFSSNEKIIIFAGSLIRKKGIFDLVSAMEKLYESVKEFRLVIAGPGHYDQVIKAANTMWSKICITGSLDKNALNDFYTMADLGIVPSYIEQCSYTCIEMMHSGLPVIVSDVDGLREMVNEKCGMKVQVDFKKDSVSLNQKDLVKKLSFLLNNPKIAKEFAANAKKYALRYFNTNRMGKETIDVYSKVLGKPLVPKQEQIVNVTEQPFVTVLLPCFNAEKYLKACLENIILQSFTNFEVIIIDDGSIDNTEQIIKDFKDPRIIYIKNKSNKGVTYSLNKGISLARGKYISRIDADDVMVLDRLQEQVSFLENNKDYVMVGSGHYRIDAYDLPIGEIDLITENDELKLAILFFNPFSHPTVTYKADLVKALLYDNKYMYCEDYELWFRLAEKGKIKNLELNLVHYRVHEKNLTTNNISEMRSNVVEMLSKELSKLEIKYTPQELMMHCTFGFGIARQFFNTKERIDDLNRWLDKFFNAPKIKAKYSRKTIIAFRKRLLEIVNSQSNLLIQK